MRKWAIGSIVATCAAAAAAMLFVAMREDESPPAPAVIEVHPGDDVQAALDRAAKLPNKAVVRLHAGVYRPTTANEAFIAFNARHDGVVLEGDGDVVLTAANPDVADKKAPSFPAIVNHVVYFGDGVSERTVLRNITISGANGFIQAPPEFKQIESADDLVQSSRFIVYSSSIESNAKLPKSHYYFTDGGAILIYGRSYPTIENVEIAGNRSTVCAGGVSIQHHPAAFGGTVRIRNCIFRDNVAGTSGSAVDLLTPGGAAVIENCLFVGNLSDGRVVLPQNNRFGALTVFPDCQVTVKNCTFTRNSSGADDRGESSYENSIFWHNTLPGGVSEKPAFEMNIVNAANVRGCAISGPTCDLQGNISRVHNRFNLADPAFDAAFRATHPAYAGTGFQPFK